jgi:hypothetical protein
MFNILKVFTFLLLLCLFVNVLIIQPTSACKDIIACGNATDGDYNLLMKVRDPSRPGLQVLCIIPKDYKYDYHHPWTGKTMSFTTEKKYIGVASQDDIIPNIVKAGMTLTTSGLAFGDADTGSRWINPTKNAWDDFDWIRYACEKAKNEDEAVKLLTKEAVDELHATGVSENLFIVGPKKGFIVEGDAYRYDIKEIYDGVILTHNYPKELWKTQYLKTRPISRFFDTTVEKFVRNKQVVRLQSIYGLKVVNIGEDFINVKPVPFIYIAKTGNIGVTTTINLGERKSVGDFSVTLLEIAGNKAKIRVTNVFKAWEEKMLEYIQPEIGEIDVKDMIKWSRFTSEDLDGLRAVCQESVKYEGVAIYKIPKNDYETLSMGWFSANHACTSIYVPFHICNTDFFDPYENGEAAELSLNLMDEFDDLSEHFIKTEDVFLYEIDKVEDLSNDLLKKRYDVSDFITIIDMGMQRQAYVTQEMWMEINKKNKQQEISEIIAEIWNTNFSTSLKKMESAVSNLTEIQRSAYFQDKIVDIALDICKTRIDAAGSIGKDILSLEEEYDKAEKELKKGEYKRGFDSIHNTYSACELILQGKTIEDIKTDEQENEKSYLIVILILIFLVLIIFLVWLKKK